MMGLVGIHTAPCLFVACFDVTLRLDLLPAVGTLLFCWHAVLTFIHKLLCNISWAGRDAGATRGAVGVVTLEDDGVLTPSSGVSLDQGRTEAR